LWNFELGYALKLSGLLMNMTIYPAVM
jgi:hypothetical protein